MKNWQLIILVFISYQGLSQTRFNPYVQQLPIDQMAQVGAYKQQIYNSRVNVIQKNINTIVKNIELLSIGSHLKEGIGLKPLLEDPGTYVSNGILERLNKKHSIILNNYINSIGSLDLTSDYIFNSILKKLNQINNDVNDDLSPLLD
jgi:type IV secretory pathway TrbF-like protein